MPIDLRCPGCAATIPVTEAGSPSAVECPYCEHEFTALPEQLGVSARSTAAPAKKSEAKKKAGWKRRDDDDEDEDGSGEKDRLRDRRGAAGGTWTMLAVAGVGLLVVFGGIGWASYLLLSIDDKPTASAPSSGSGGGKSVGPSTSRPNTPSPGITRPNTATRPGPGPGRPGPVEPEPITPDLTPKKAGNPPKKSGAAPPANFSLTPVPGTPFDISPTPLVGTGPVTVELPGRAETALVAGGGRFVALHFPPQRKLALFDVNEGRVTREVTLDPDAEVRVAAGLNTLAVIYPARRVVQRYSLPDLTREAAGTFPGGVYAAAMGSATNGPLFVAAAPPAGPPEVSLYDLAVMRPVAGSNRAPSGVLIQPAVQVRAAANGTLFTAALPGRMGPAVVFAARDGGWSMGPQLRSPLAIPGPAGEVVYGHGEMFGPDGRSLGPTLSRAGQGVWLVPAARGPSFLKLTEKREKIGAKAKNSQVLTVHTDADAQRAVATVGELPELEGLVDWRPTGGPLPLDRHLFYVAEAKLLAVLPSSRDKLILRRVEVQ